MDSFASQFHNLGFREAPDAAAGMAQRFLNGMEAAIAVSTPPSPTKHRRTADEATSFTTRAGACIGQISTALTPSKVSARGGAELV